MTFDVLRALQAIIADGINEIEHVYATAGDERHAFGTKNGNGHRLDFPSLDSPGDPDSPSEKLSSHPDVLAAVARIVSATSHLATAVRAPFLTLCDASMSYHLPACLRFLEAAHIPELLHPAGEAGMAADEIARRVDVDTSTTSHILRLLATHHILREVRPDYFALNRISAMLDSGKEFEALRAKKQWKYDGQGQKAAFFALNTDELFKAGAYLTDIVLPDAVTDDTAVCAEPLVPQTAECTDPKHLWAKMVNSNDGRACGDVSALKDAALTDETPELPLAAFNLSQRTSIPYWTWLEAPGNEACLARFGRAMGGSQGWEEIALEALGDHPFPDLAPGSVVVDVGGGIGSTTMRLAKRFPDLRFVVQDRAPVCKLGEELRSAQAPEMLSSGRVRFQAHDFFRPQPVRAPAVFLVRVVCHDWPDDFAQRILLQLRKAAGPNTKLVIGDHILPYAVESARDGVTDSTPVETEFADIEGARDVQLLRGARWPLLSNFGTASANAYWMDLTMKTIFNGKERTLPEHVALAASAGWKVVRVSGIEGSLFGHLVAVPAPIPAADLPLPRRSM